MAGATSASFGTYPGSAFWYFDAPIGLGHHQTFIYPAWVHDFGSIGYVTRYRLAISNLQILWSVQRGIICT